MDAEAPLEEEHGYLVDRSGYEFYKTAFEVAAGSGLCRLVCPE